MDNERVQTILADLPNLFEYNFYMPDANGILCQGRIVSIESAINGSIYIEMIFEGQGKKRILLEDLIRDGHIYIVNAP